MHDLGMTRFRGRSHWKAVTFYMLCTSGVYPAQQQLDKYLSSLGARLTEFEPHLFHALDYLGKFLAVP